MTVSDMDRAIEFYSTVLSFQKVSDVEVLRTEYEQLQGLFGVRLRVVRMQLGEELIELTEYLTPKGRPIPVDSRSHDRWFQHIAIVVSDMDRAYQQLRRFKVQRTSTAPQRVPDSAPLSYITVVILCCNTMINLLNQVEVAPRWQWLSTSLVNFDQTVK